MGYAVPPELENINMNIEEHAEENPEEEVSKTSEGDEDQYYQLEPAYDLGYKDRSLEKMYNFADYKLIDIDVVEEIVEEVFEPSFVEVPEEEKVEEEEKTESEHEDLALREMPETIDVLAGGVDITKL